MSGDDDRPVASRHDRGYTEEASFDDDGRLVFTTSPVAAAIGTVVFASSVHTELQRNYRREVLLARAAAVAGFATIRFHYRGAGNSAPPPSAPGPTLDTMAADLRAMIDRAGPGTVAVVATRLAAPVAGRLRAERDLPLVMWEPVLDGDRWVDEVVKACLAREVARGDDVTATDVRNRWQTDGEVFALGESVRAELVDQVAGASFAEEIAGSRPVLVVQMGRTAKVRPAVERLRAALAEAGVDVSVLPIVGHQVWWLKVGGDRFDPIENQASTAALNDGIVDWLKRMIA